MQKIDPSARVSEKTSIEDDVVIGPWVIIEDEVTIGTGTIIDAHCVIKKGTTIGKQNEIHPGAIIGEDPQDLVFDKNVVSYVQIGFTEVLSMGQPLLLEIIIFLWPSHTSHTIV